MSEQPIGVVFGASGYLGGGLCRRLTRDRRTVAFARNPQRVEGNERLVRAAMGEVTLAPPAADRASLGVGDAPLVVFQCVGSSRERPPNFIRETNLGATRNVVAWCLANSVNRLVYFSGFGVGPSTTAVYFRAKYDAEQAIIAECEGRIEYVILRPSYIVGGGHDELLPHLIGQASRGDVVVPGLEDYLIQPLLMEDVAAIAQELRDTPSLESGIYDLLGEPVSTEGFYRAILERLGWSASTHRRPVEEYIREAIVNENATMSLCQIAILCSNIVGPWTETRFGQRVRGVSEIVSALVEEWRQRIA